jgi:hypothetical protein
MIIVEAGHAHVRKFLPFFFFFFKLMTGSTGKSPLKESDEM